jgi:hypothetical protein
MVCIAIGLEETSGPVLFAGGRKKRILLTWPGVWSKKWGVRVVIPLLFTPCSPLQG